MTQINIKSDNDGFSIKLTEKLTEHEQDNTPEISQFIISKENISFIEDYLKIMEVGLNFHSLPLDTDVDIPYQELKDNISSHAKIRSVLQHSQLKRIENIAEPEPNSNSTKNTSSYAPELHFTRQSQEQKIFHAQEYNRLNIEINALTDKLKSLPRERKSSQLQESDAYDISEDLEEAGIITDLKIDESNLIQLLTISQQLNHIFDNFIEKNNAFNANQLNTTDLAEKIKQAYHALNWSSILLIGSYKGKEHHNLDKKIDDLSVNIANNNIKNQWYFFQDKVREDLNSGTFTMQSSALIMGIILSCSLSCLIPTHAPAPLIGFMSFIDLASCCYCSYHLCDCFKPLCARDPIADAARQRLLKETNKLENLQTNKAPSDQLNQEIEDQLDRVKERMNDLMQTPISNDNKHSPPASPGPTPQSMGK